LIEILIKENQGLNDAQFTLQNLEWGKLEEDGSSPGAAALRDTYQRRFHGLWLPDGA
jgi:hypothetical protein